MTLSAIVRALAAAGATPDMIAAAVEAAEADALAKEEARKARNRDRMRSVRKCARTDMHSSAQDAHPPLKEIPPTPPKENNPPPEPIGSDSFDARAIRREFDEEFWPAWPSKVAKKPALKAFIAARKRETLETILDGVRRYARTKPEGRDWMHPTTFLNQERWNDEPASPSKATGKQRPHDALFRAIAEQTQAGHGADQWPSDPDAGLRDHPGGASTSRERNLDLPPENYRWDV